MEQTTRGDQGESSHKIYEWKHLEDKVEEFLVSSPPSILRFRSIMTNDDLRHVRLLLSIFNENEFFTVFCV
jgi:hypothetical protein